MNTHLVPFHGETITAIETPEGIFVAVAPLCERFGVSRQTQQRKFNSMKSVWGVRHMMHPTDGGMQSMMFLPLNRLAMWLASISPAKVHTQYRDALITYQIEAADVLDRHFRLRQQEQEGELAFLREQQARIRAFTLAFNPLWNKISRLQEARIGRRQVWGMFGGRTRNYIDVTIEHMEGAGVIHPEDWDDHIRQVGFDAPTPVEAAQHEMALQFGDV
jgi:hypothetical protein